MALQKSSKMSVGGCGVAAVHALHCQAVAGEGVIGFIGNELFEHLAAGFLLFSHWVVPYYTGAGDSDQKEVDSQRKNEELTRRSRERTEGTERKKEGTVRCRDRGKPKMRGTER